MDENWSDSGPKPLLMATSFISFSFAVEEIVTHLRTWLILLCDESPRVPVFPYKPLNVWSKSTFLLS